MLSCAMRPSMDGCHNRAVTRELLCAAAETFAGKNA
jgi:hypothetical protein